MRCALCAVRCAQHPVLLGLVLACAHRASSLYLLSLFEYAGSFSMSQSATQSAKNCRARRRAWRRGARADARRQNDVLDAVCGLCARVHTPLRHAPLSAHVAPAHAALWYALGNGGPSLYAASRQHIVSDCHECLAHRIINRGGAECLHTRGQTCASLDCACSSFFARSSNMPVQDAHV
jgi:hypothetical protein